MQHAPHHRYIKIISFILILVLANSVYCQDGYYMVNYELRLIKMRKTDKIKVISPYKKIIVKLTDGKRLHGVFSVDMDMNLIVDGQIVDLTEVETVRIGLDRRLWLGPAFVIMSIAVCICGFLLFAVFESLFIPVLAEISVCIGLAGFGGIFYYMLGFLRPIRAYHLSKWELQIIETPPKSIKLPRQDR